MDKFTIATEVPKDHREVIRLKTSYWHDDKGVHMRKDLLCLKRHSTGCQILPEDAAMAGADKVIPNIVNLNTCEDGLYEVVLCNEQKDWETGYLDNWDYKLVPFKP